MKMHLVSIDVYINNSSADCGQTIARFFSFNAIYIYNNKLYIYACLKLS